MLSNTQDYQPEHQISGYALHRAARAGQTQEVRRLLQLGADIDERGGGKATPLHRAVSGAHEETVRFLIDQGASVDLADLIGRYGTTKL